MPPQGAAKIVTYPAFNAGVEYGEGQINLTFLDGTATAHVFPLPPEAAKQIRDGLIEALSGIQVAQVVPGQENGKGLL